MILLLIRFTKELDLIEDIHIELPTWIKGQVTDIHICQIDYEHELPGRIHIPRTQKDKMKWTEFDTWTGFE